jgi:hypothetical protein
VHGRQALVKNNSRRWGGAPRDGRDEPDASNFSTLRSQLCVCGLMLSNVLLIMTSTRHTGMNLQIFLRRYK